jgi:hypothetical protein
MAIATNSCFRLNRANGSLDHFLPISEPINSKRTQPG